MRVMRSIAFVFIFVVIVLLVLGGLGYFYYAYFTPPSPKPQGFKPGPSSSMVSTQGLFKPGGFIEFVVDPKIKSVHGIYRATIFINPALNENMREGGIVWPGGRMESSHCDEGEHVSGCWGDRITGSMWVRSMTFVVRLDIPNNPSLSGQEIPIEFTVELLYPSKVDDYHFVDEQVEIHETFWILIE